MNKKNFILINDIKNYFESQISKKLNLTKIPAPLFLAKDTYLNDELNGIEKSVNFEIYDMDREAEIIHSLAKWKRVALKKYSFKQNEGILTDMKAVRRNEITDNIHSILVDQWDWEVIINKNQSKTISVTFGGSSILLRPNECVVGLFCDNKCLQLLDNVASDYDSKVSLKLSVKGTSLMPICEVHRSTGIQYIESVASIAVEADGSIVYSTMNGDICYNKDCFSLDLRITSFKEKEYSKDLLAFKKDSSGNYIFYCKNKINY